MKTYFFEVYDRDRKKLSLALEFETTSDFHRYLRRNKFILIKYRVGRKKYRISKREIINFTQNLKLLLESGLTITSALDILISQEKSKFNEILKNIQLKILEGSNLYSAFSAYREIFRESYLNIILAGEESGRLLENLERICENLIFEEKLKKKIKESTFYPIIILIFTLLLITFILIFVFPNFIDFFNDTGVELPLLTRVLIEISNNFYIITFVFFVLFIGLYIFLRRLEAEKVENIKLSIPLYGKILKRRLLIELCKNFSIMGDAGIEVVNILEILKKGSIYNFQKRELSKIQLRIKIGNSISEGFSLTGFFNATQLHLIEIGEKSGALEKTFASIAYTMEKELEFYLFKLTSLIEPLLLLILGVIVGIMILGLYLPIFNISQII